MSNKIWNLNVPITITITIIEIRMKQGCRQGVHYHYNTPFHKLSHIAIEPQVNKLIRRTIFLFFLIIKFIFIKALFFFQKKKGFFLHTHIYTLIL